MACPFSIRPRQASMAETGSWTIEDDGSDGTSLTLKNLNAAIQLLTAPTVR